MIDRGGRSLSARARVVLVAALVGTSLTALASSATAVGSGTTELISATPSGTAGNESSGNYGGDVGVSDDGRYVVFTSDATDLVPGDENGVSDVFVRDRSTGETRLVSQDASGGFPEGISYGARISGNGRYVVFTSTGGLVPADINDLPDAYVHDLVTGTTELGSLAGDGSLLSGGQLSLDISGDGSQVLFSSADPTLTGGQGFGVFARDRLSGAVARMDVASDGTPANKPSAQPRISANGRFVGYASEADNLVADDALACTDYIYPEPDPSLPPGWPGDGEPEVVAVNCMDVFVHDRDPDGDGTLDVGATTVLASVTDDGTQGNGTSSGGSVSDDGDVVFWSNAPNLGNTSGPNTFVRTSDGVTARVGDGTANIPVITPDGRHVAFDSYLSQDPSTDTNDRTDVFVRDLQDGTLERISVADDGSELADGGVNPAVSADGRFVTFTSYEASFLPPGSPSGFANLFLRDRAGVPPPTNAAPVAQDSSRTVPADETSAVLLSASDPDGDPLTYTVTDAPEHGTLGGTAPALTYTPDAGYAGPDSIGYTVADGRGGSDTAVATLTVSASGERSVTQTVEPGQTVSSGAEPTAEAPTQAAVTTPDGGEVTITESPAAAGPTGYDLVGSTYQIEAPDASVEAPLRISFVVDAAALPEGLDPSTLTVFRNGTAIEPCADSSGTATPDPCLAERLVEDGVVRLAVLTSHASSWAVAVPEPRATALSAAPAVLRLNAKPPAVRTVVLAATLTVDGAAVPDEVITFTAKDGRFLCQATTNADGTASCRTTATGMLAVILGAGYHARFDGTPLLAPSEATAGLARGSGGKP